MRETKQASKAVRILTEQYHAASKKHAEELAAVAFESDGVDPADGWLFNVQTAEYQRDVPEEASE